MTARLYFLKTYFLSYGMDVRVRSRFHRDLGYPPLRRSDFRNETTRGLPTVQALYHERE